MNETRDALKGLLEKIPDVDEYRPAKRQIWELFRGMKKPETKVERVTVVDPAKDAEIAALKEEVNRLKCQRDGYKSQTQELQKAVADKEALLVTQRGKGYNTVMIQDFLDQLRGDLEDSVTDLSGGDSAKVSGLDPQIYMNRYGQLGGFVPWHWVHADGEEGQKAMNALLDKIVAEHQASLDALDTLKDDIAFALEAARHPSQAYIKEVRFDAEGNMTVEAEGFEEMDKAAKRRFKKGF